MTHEPTPPSTSPHAAGEADSSPADESASTVRDRRALLTALTGTALAAATTVGVAAAVQRGTGTTPDTASTGGAPAEGDGTSPTDVPVDTGDGAGNHPTPSLPPADADETLRRRLRRATFGVTASLVADVEERGWDTWLDEQLDPERVDDRDVEESIAAYATLTMAPDQRRELVQAGDEGRQRVNFEVRHATLVRAVHSARQLREVLVDHWNNHFNVDVSDQVVALTKADEDAAFRGGALGSFHDLLVASATSPSMLRYLDNASSRTPSPNENYGRELLELHTVGVDGGYDEDDVVDTARVFTGWSIDRTTLEFVFRPGFHDAGPKSVLGWSTAGMAGADGVEEGRALLRHLADHPSTARHVTRRLVQRLVADVPPDDVVDVGLAAWEASGGTVGAVVRAILDPAVFDGAVGSKVSRPFEALATTLRRLGATVPTDLTDPGSVRPAVALHQGLSQLGQPLFRAPAPTGYADVAPAWVSTNSVSARWQLAIAVVAARSVLGFDLDRFRADDTITAARAAAEDLWLRTPTDDEVDALLDAADASPTDRPDDPTIAGLVALVLATGVAHER